MLCFASQHLLRNYVTRVHSTAGCSAQGRLSRMIDRITICLQIMKIRLFIWFRINIRKTFILMICFRCSPSLLNQSNFLAKEHFLLHIMHRIYNFEVSEVFCRISFSN